MKIPSPSYICSWLVSIVRPCAHHSRIGRDWIRLTFIVPSFLGFHVILLGISSEKAFCITSIGKAKEKGGEGKKKG
jgi:hypothetical protein